MAKLKQIAKAKVGLPLHQQIALGVKPKNVQTTRGLSSATVNNLKKK